MIKKWFITGFVLFLSFMGYAQELKTYQVAIENVLEKMAENNEGELDFEEIAGDLEYFAENPLNLNSATRDDLEKLPMLNDFQVVSLLDYLHHHGPMATIYELRIIEGFDYNTIGLLIPFVTIGSGTRGQSWRWNDALKYGDHELFVRGTSNIETQAGYNPDSLELLNPEKYYPGNKIHLYTRYIFNYKRKLLWGMTMEKDPGEEWFQGTQKQGFDFYSFHLQVNDLGIVKTAVIGDFQAQFGQGLIMWSGMGSGKSAYVMDIRKKAGGLKKYSSTDENAFLRGAGATIKLSNLEFTTFASYHKKDANLILEDGTSGGNDYFSAFDISGIHATPSQIEKKDAVTELAAGGNIGWNKKMFRCGLSGIAYQYDVPLQKDEKPYNQFDFRGKQNANLGTDFQLMFSGLHFFGEAAVSQNGGKAFLSGVLMELAPQMSASVLYRNYARNYQAQFANAFAEGSHPWNEQGIYFGTEIHPIRRWKLSAYYDSYQFPWLKQDADAPSYGYDYLVQADFEPSVRVSMYWRVKQEIKEKNSSEPVDALTPLTQTDHLSARYHISYSPGEHWRLNNRVEVSRYNTDQTSKEYGYLLYQDIIGSPLRIPLSFAVRYAIFQTESYDTRIYTYEYDVLNGYSIPALYDKGTRAYLLIKYQVAQSLDVWVRYARTWYAHKQAIGSGLNEIDGNTKSEIKVQLRWKI